MSRTDVPEWVKRDCMEWGRQKLRIWRGADWHGNEDGWVSSLLGRIREERDGAAQSFARQSFPEVFTNAGLDVQRAINGLPENPYIVGHMHYVWPRELAMSVRQKSKLIELKLTLYFEALGNFEFWVFSRLQAQSVPGPQLTDALKKMLRDELKTEGVTSTKAHPVESARTKVFPRKTNTPSLALDALHRPTITLPRKSGQ